MDFTPKTWLTGDVITAIELNRIETGIEDAEIAIDALEIKSPVITLAGDLTGSVTLTNLNSGTLTATVVDDSHNHVIANVDNLQSSLDAKAASATTISAGTGLTGGGSLAGNRTISIASGGVGTLQIAASAVTSSEIAADAVTNSKIAAGAVGTTELATDAVTAGKIAAGAVGDSELASGITVTQFANGTVSNTEFQYLNGVTSAIQTQLNGKLSTSGTAADSNLLDTLNSTQFLRSDANDTYTGAAMTFDSGATVTVQGTLIVPIK